MVDDHRWIILKPNIIGSTWGHRDKMLSCLVWPSSPCPATLLISVDLPCVAWSILSSWRGQGGKTMAGLTLHQFDSILAEMRKEMLIKCDIMR